MTAERIIEAAAAGLRSAATHSGHRCINNINTGIDGKFCQLETVGSSLELYDPENLDEVRDFLACMEADDDEYAYLALRGSDGLYYTSWGSDAASDEELAPAASWGCRIGTRTATT